MVNMENAKRKNGFIALDELTKTSDFRNIPWQNNESMLEEYGHSNVKYIFY